MKRKYADRPNWKRVLSRKMIIENIESEHFKGQAVLIQIDKVREPLYVDLCGTQQCVVDNGYSWMTLFSQNKNYVITVMFNQQGQVVQWYIDICGGQGYTKDGIPWYDDLYLDIIISSDFKVELIDQDDLQYALEQGIITKQQADFAYTQANELLSLIKDNRFPILKASLQLYEAMLKKLENRYSQRKD